MEHEGRTALAAVIAVPCLWQLDNGSQDIDEVCLHVARERFGESAQVVDLDDPRYVDALLDLALECARQGREMKVVDRELCQVRIGGPTWKEAGLRWVRLVEA